jgi:hypothetical protein
MCRNGFRALAAAAILGSAGTASAQVADLRQASCEQLLGMPESERMQLSLWLHGYYAGAAQRSQLDRAKLEDGVAALQKACATNRAMPLIGIEARAALTGEPNPMAPQAPPPGAAQPGQPAAPAAPPAAITPSAPAGPARPTPLR